MGRLPGRVNYFRGHRAPARSIPTFRQVLYRGVYPGIDLTSGAMMPAAVMMATVAEPCAARMVAETM